MENIKPEYSRSKIEKAGKMISKFSEKDDEFDNYIPVVDNWRASHAFPLNEIVDVLNKSLTNDNSIKFVQRLKRLESIINKLKRENNTGLYRMQDLAGCRIIVQNISQISHYVEVVKSAIENSGHKIVKEYDYINNPRTNSGYRSYHIVVEYNSKENVKFNGMFVEIQIRTVLENLWATTVEIIDFMMSETLKAGTGKESYMRFFKLVSGLFSIDEGTHIVQGIPTEKHKIIKEIFDIDKIESIRKKLYGFNDAFNLCKEINNSENSVYFLLHFDLKTNMLKVTSYTYKATKKAIEDYHNYEKDKKNNSVDVLLVSAKNFDVIKDSYPNYFMDTLQFLQNVTRLCIDYPEQPSIIISTNNNSEKICNLFDIIEYNGIELNNMYIAEDCIGAVDGDIIHCPPWAATFDNSYLRFSGIVLNNNRISGNGEIKTIDLNSPGIIALNTGASFIVCKKNWRFISETNSVLIKCKKNVKIEYLYILISWLKSNLCLWNILFNFNSNTIARKKVYSELFMPILSENNYNEICLNCNQILDEEDRFVKNIIDIDTNKNKSSEDIDIIYEKFNNKIRNVLKKNELIFNKHYNISDADIGIIQNEIGLKGYFVY